MAAPFDLRTLAVTGPAVAVIDGVPTVAVQFFPHWIARVRSSLRSRNG